MEIRDSNETTAVTVSVLGIKSLKYLVESQTPKSPLCHWRNYRKTEVKPYNRHFSLNVISLQVSFVQYSDEVKSEFKLNTYNDKALALGALQNIRYRGGNTRTGTV